MEEERPLTADRSGIRYVDLAARNSAQMAKSIGCLTMPQEDAIKAVTCGAPPELQLIGVELGVDHLVLPQTGRQTESHGQGNTLTVRWVLVTRAWA